MMKTLLKLGTMPYLTLRAFESIHDFGSRFLLILMLGDFEPLPTPPSYSDIHHEISICAQLLIANAHWVELNDTLANASCIPLSTLKRSILTRDFKSATGIRGRCQSQRL